MSDFIQISRDSSKIINLSDNYIFSNSLNDNFQTINSSKITNFYKNRKKFINYNRNLSFRQIEKNIYSNFKNLYYHDKHFYNIKVINDIINNYDTHMVAEFKDYLIMGDDSEFLQKIYKLNESRKYLPVLFDYYKSCSIIFPNYVMLHESKYIFKNIRKKQKVIDNQQEQDDKQEKIKKGELKLEDNNIFFTTNALNSILNQTNTSNIKIFFGLNNNKKNKNKNKKNNNKNNDNDSEETVNNIYNNIVNAENNASHLTKKKFFLKKKYLKNILKIGKIDENKSQNNINNKSFKGKIKKKSNNVRKENNKFNSIGRSTANNTIIKHKINQIEKIRNNNTENNINVLYYNINNLKKPKYNINLNNKSRHVKSNTCIFETDANIALNKKQGFFDTNNSTKKKIFKIDNSNRQLLNKKADNNNNKKEIIANKEIISKIIYKIKNANNFIFKGNKSFNNINKKKLIINMKKHHKINSISPNYNLANVNKKNNFDFNIKINESHSTPNIYNLKINRIIKKNTIKKNNTKNENPAKITEKKVKEKEKGKNIKLKFLKLRNNINISPANKGLIINNSYKMRNNINNSNNISNYNKTNNSISKTIKNKVKNNEKEKTKERQKLNLNINKIYQGSNTYRYITSNNKNNKNEYPQSSNKAMTITGLKNACAIKLNSIQKINKNRNSKNKNKKSDINNNININININSNNIFNSTNQMNNSSNINISNSIFNSNNNSNSFNQKGLNKKKYYEIIRQSSSFISKGNENHHKMLKKMILSASNNIIFNNSKKNIFYEENRKKHSVLNTNNTLTFSGCLTSRNSQNSSRIKNTDKKDNINLIGNLKTNITSYKVKKELFDKKKEKKFYSKNKIPTIKNQKENYSKKGKNKFNV